MKTEVIFKPTATLKELLILTLISKENDINQRKLATEVGSSLAMINSYLDEYEKNGYISRIYDTPKIVKYIINKKGEERRKVLSIQYLESSLNVYNSAKVECVNMLNQISIKGYKNVLFYGAGEVAEIMLYVINNSNDISINVLAVIDDDINKIGKKITNVDIISINDISKYAYDGILVSSYTNNVIMKNKLIKLGINNNKIIEFFK